MNYGIPLDLNPPVMLTAAKPRNLKPRGEFYMADDCDGLYAAVTRAGAISFRYNHSIHGRQVPG